MDRVYAALARIPTFRDVRPEAVELEPLSSLTNATYKVTANGLAYTLRLPGKDTYEYVDRAAEEHNARIMAAAGVNAKVLYFDATDGTMLSEFVEGDHHERGEVQARFRGAGSRRPGAKAGSPPGAGLQVPLRCLLHDRRLPRHPAQTRSAIAGGLPRR